MTDTIDFISTILDHKPTPEEKVMLDHFSGINSLVIADEALALYRLCMRLPSHKRILEIGSYRGGSTVAMGHAALSNQLTIFCIDMWAGYQQQSDFVHMDQSLLNDMTILSEFISNTAFVKDRLCMLRGNAATFRDILGSSLFSLVFIDGAHDYFSVIDDIIFGLKVIEPGGILCGHDYHSAGIDVKKAVHDVIMNSEAASIKGLIGRTSIWYAVIEDPDYELLMASTIKQMALGNFNEAYRLLASESSTRTKTPEIERLLCGLEKELGRAGSRLTS